MGRKRHLVVNTLGLIIRQKRIVVHAQPDILCTSWYLCKSLPSAPESLFDFQRIPVGQFLKKHMWLGLVPKRDGGKVVLQR